MKIRRGASAPIAAGGFRQRLFEAFCLFIVAACCILVAWSQSRSTDLLDFESGAVILSATTEYDRWPALALLDGDPHTGWASRRGHVAGNEIVIELPHVYQLESMAFDNTRAQEIEFPGVSTRDIEVWLSTSGADDGFEKVVEVQATQGGREQFPLPLYSTARWVKLVIASNWGSEEFTELMEVAAYGSPVGEVPAPRSVSGTYLTNFGPLYLEQSAERVRGCYDDGSGMIRGSLDGRVMRLQWQEPGRSGSALLTVSAGGGFINGLWYQDNELSGTWRGPRDPGNPRPPCDIDRVAWPE